MKWLKLPGKLISLLFKPLNVNDVAKIASEWMGLMTYYEAIQNFGLPVATFSFGEQDFLLAAWSP